MRLAPKLVRAATGVAMIAAGTPAVWALSEPIEPSLFEPYIVWVFLFLAWGSGWAVLGAWTWSGTRAVQGWRRTVGVFVTVLLVLAALVSLVFLAYLEAANLLWGYPPELDQLALLCPGLLVGGVWVLSGLRRRAPDPV